jgi:hypothetical protein
VSSGSKRSNVQDTTPDSGVSFQRLATRHAGVFIAGTVVMVVEILGTRIVGPVFGVSLFVWSALLAVTLCALAVGYYLGGSAVDRHPSERLFGLVILTAGVLLGLTPLYDHPVLGVAERLGPRFGPLLAASLLFGPALLALGMVGPIAVRLATHDVRSTGRRVGMIYTISTGGSLLAVFLTSFVLIPSFETSHILAGSAIALVLAGAVPLALTRKPVAFGALIFPLLSALVPHHPDLPPGLSVTDRSHSPYSLVEVIEDTNRGLRLLRADHSIIGGYYTLDRSACFAFLHILEALRFIRPAAKDLLQVGLGTGALPMALQPFGVRSDVVEIDPEVVRLARERFDFRTEGAVFTEDARTFLRNTRRSYDLIVHDTFTGGSTPDHLLSVEVIRRIQQLLHPGGVLALNFPGYLTGTSAEAAWAVTRTLRAVFPFVRAFRDRSPDDRPDEASNLVFFCSDAAMTFTVPPDAHFENSSCEQIVKSFSSWEVLRSVPAGALITDDRNPLLRLQLSSAEDHFRAMSQLLPREVWLY